ncbi:hypothetical protein BG262_02875 [Floricoccus penangensis]|uniref:Phage tail tape measure protein n=1 Tax=Floricoccus penangensis TaxID=1859475 RepID=A0A9Q5JGL2_9LACT|nr:hypothetical protein [Floricoccus penangensis]OFI46758.1 hypothetical protein BG262_02875 [Floricoccus penangensis]
MAASGIGQFSINVKSNLKDFYGTLYKTSQTMDELTKKKHQLQIDSKKLDELRDKSQRIAAEMRDLRQQKTEIRIGIKDTKIAQKEIEKIDIKISKLRDEKNSINLDPSKVKDASKQVGMIDKELNALSNKRHSILMNTVNIDEAQKKLNELDKSIASKNGEKLKIEADIQPIRTANAELYKVDQEIDRINNSKVKVDFGSMASGLDAISGKIMEVTKALAGIASAGAAATASFLKDSVNAASDLEQNTGGVEKLFGASSQKVLEDSKKAYKEAGISQNEYLEQSTTFSASLIKAFENGSTETIDSKGEKEALKKKKADIEKEIKELNNKGTQLNIDSEPKYIYKNGKKKKVDDTDKKATLKDYKQQALDLKKQKEQIDEQINNLPGKSTKTTGKLSKEDAQSEAAKYANQAIIDMSDNANVFGTNMSEIQNAYNGFAKNNFTMLDNLKLGFAGSQEGAIELVNAYGGLDHEVTSIGQVTMPLMIESIHNAQEAMKITGTTAKEAAETYEGSMKMMKSAWQDFLATGDASKLLDAIPTYLTNLDKKLEELTPKIIESFKKLAKELPEKIKPILEKMGSALKEILDSVLGEGFTDNFVNGMKPFFNGIKWLFDVGSKTFGSGDKNFAWIGTAIPALLKLVIGLKVVSGILKTLNFLGNFKMPGIGSLFSSFGKDKEGGIGSVGKIDLGMLKKVGTGLLVIAGIAGTIWIVAKAFQEVANIDGDFGSIAGKIGAMTLGIIAIGGLALVVGAIMSTGIGTGILIAGLLGILGIVGTIWLVGKAFSSLVNMNLDKESIKTAIIAITDSLDVLRDSFTGYGLGEFFDDIKHMISNFMDSLIIDQLIGIGNNLQKLAELQLDSASIKSTIIAITDSLDIMHAGFTGYDFNSFFEDVANLISNFMDAKLLDQIMSMGEELAKLQELELDSKAISSTFNAINTAIESMGSDDESIWDKLGSLFGGKLDEGNYGELAESFAKLNEIAVSLQAIQSANLDEKELPAKIKILKDAIESISTINTTDITSDLQGVSNALDAMIQKISKDSPPKFLDLGKKLADKVNQGFSQNLNLNNAIKNSIMRVGTNQIEDLGSKLARMLNNSFSKNLKIGSSINNATKGTKFSFSASDGTPRATMASGGLATRDVILNDSPEHPMIANGEWVVPKKIVDKLGTGFLTRLNQGTISRTFQGLGQSISNATSSIINNNYYNNYNEEKNVNIYNGNSMSEQMIDSRYAGGMV